MMNIIPIGKRVLLLPKIEQRTKGGIYLPEETSEGKKEGEVVAIGTTADGETLPIKPGDHVVYGGYEVDELEFQGKNYVMVEFKDIIAKVE